MSDIQSRPVLWSLSLAVAAGVSMGVQAQEQPTRTIGEVTALIAEASTADEPAEFAVDGQSGDTDFPFINRMKPIATVGEYDAETGNALTGYPDGNAAYLLDQDTVRVIYQSESYGTMSNETYPWEMTSGVSFTGSQIHTIDYDRYAMASFLDNDNPASRMVEGSGHLFDTVYNVFGEEVQPRSESGRWGNQTLPSGEVVTFNEDYQLSEADFFFQSFCGAYYEQANKYGHGVGFADDIWLTAEEWEIGTMYEGTGVTSEETMGLASVAVDINSGVAYTAPALGQTGYEKILPINPKHPDYVVLVMAGYNHGVEPAPLKLYVGRKGVDENNDPIGADASERDQFLARNGLLYGKLYGMAVANETYADLGIESIDTQSKMLDAYMRDANAPDQFNATFVPTSYQWEGFDSPVAVKDTEMYRWQAAEEQPAGHTYFVGDSKTEHPAVDPNPNNQRYIQNMTNSGGMLGVELTGFLEEIDAADGDLPQSISAEVTRVLPAVDGSLRLATGGKGIKHGGAGTAATWEDGQAKAVSPDGMMWIRTADANLLIVDEDSGNAYGERKYAIRLNPETMRPAEGDKGYFLAMAGGSENPRAKNQVSAYGGTFSKAASSEFSGSWNVTALLARKPDGTFYTPEELAGPKRQQINAATPTDETLLLGVVQHKGESGGAIAEMNADQGGQIFLFDLAIPAALSGSGSLAQQ